MAWILALAAVSGLAGVQKLIGVDRIEDVRARLGIARTLWRGLALAELAAGAALGGATLDARAAPLGLAAVIGMALVGIGAVGAMARLREHWAAYAPAVILLALTAGAARNLAG